MSEKQQGNTAIIAALLANLGIAVTKFIAYLISHSSSMLAESVHSLADTGNQFLLLIGGKRARREPTPEHPFGFGRERYVSAFVVSIVLFSLGGLFAVYEGIEKVANPHPLENWWLPVAVLLVSIVLEGLSLRTALKESHAARGDARLISFVRHAKAPELPVVLLEDTAALTGLVFALAGVGLTTITGNGIWDGIGTIAIGVLLVAVALVLGVETKSLLIGESASTADLERIRAAALAGDDIESIIHLRTLHIGPDDLLVAIKASVRPTESAAEIAQGIDVVEQRIRAAVPAARLIFVEPDIRREQTQSPQL
ncbi:cation diffusion facilitator family transporter [Pseudoclavibacter soli]|uniref:cation diffusion facilitator family transporter n=1 Tax=Pseudoclavibacter soli TaxID=452623 RepID=UPI00041A1120|nr:cation diffusion facilitator family transporter [Pseudoclavibacter soli]